MDSVEIPLGRPSKLICNSINLCTTLFLLLTGTLVLFISMSKSVEDNRDEHMYCTAGVLMSQGQLVYRDFTYPSQLPLHPLLYAACYWALGTNHYLLVARLLSVAAGLISVWAVLMIYRHVFGDNKWAGLFLGMMAVIWMIFNPIVMYTNGRAWNHDFVIAATLVSFWLFLHLNADAHCGFYVFAITTLLASVSWMRITTCLVYGVIVFCMLLKTRQLQKHRRFVINCLVATLVVSAWPIWVVFQAPRAFLLNLVHIPGLYGQWLQEIGGTHDKAELTWACLTEPTMLLTILLCVMAWCFHMRKPLAKTQNHLNVDQALALGLPLTFVVIAFIPPTMWDQYWAIPVPFLLAGCAYPLRTVWIYLKTPAKLQIRRSFVLTLGMMTIVVVSINPAPLLGFVFAFVPRTWIPLQMHHLAHTIHDSVEPQKKVLTLAPLWALEGNYRIYPELSCGSIVYRVADQLSDDQRILVHAVGPDSLDQLMKISPPDAIFVNTEKTPMLQSLEAPLKAQAGSNWQRADFTPGPLVLFPPQNHRP